MGIKSERRELLGLFHILGVMVLGSCIISILALMQSNVLKLEPIEFIIEILGVAKLFGIFIIIFSMINMKQNHPEKLIQNIFKKGWYFIILNIGLLGYYFVINHMKIDPLAIGSSFDAFFYSIPMTTIWLNNKFLDSDRKIAWQKACGTYNELESKNTYLWRFKINFSSLEKHFTRGDILKYSNFWEGQIFTLIFIGMIAFTQEFHAFFLLLLIKPILFLIDFLLNLVVSLEGECTGFYKKTKGRSGGSYYYIYIITNYEKKMEIKLTTDEELFFDEGSYVKVYYTLFSKYILKYHLSSKCETSNRGFRAFSIKNESKNIKL
ncbi:MAG: hypothetical protein N4A62_00460 [Marinisporobacter sp.]|jgi:hypothetical protein|nr:hypothetical protein [Marinisporobacter sp.]